MDVIKLLTHLKEMEWADGADYVSLELEKIISDWDKWETPPTEEQMATALFDIYFEDRSKTYHRAQGYIKSDIIKYLEEKE